MSDITADDNHNSIKTRNTVCLVDGEAKAVDKGNGKLYYNLKKTYNSYIKNYFSPTQSLN